MKTFLQYSSKFWNIRVGSDEFVVHYGKLGTIGKVQIKYFESEDICRKEADKLIRQKLRKGYVETDTDWDDLIYVDDPEVGPNRLTTHPRFNAHFQHEKTGTSTSSSVRTTSFQAGWSGMYRALTTGRHMNTASTVTSPSCRVRSRRLN